MNLNDQIAELTHQLEICNALKHRKTVQFRVKKFAGAKWRDADEDDTLSEAGFDTYEWRLKPEPRTVPWTQEDVPPVCWVRHNSQEAIRQMVCETNNVRVYFGPASFSVSYEELFKHYEYSVDRKEWKPCNKEVLE